MTATSGMTQAGRLLSPEEIAVKAGQQLPFLLLPERAQVFAARETRLRQLAAGHPMRDYLLFMAELVRSQHGLLQQAPEVALPDAAQIEAAARAGQPLLDAAVWPRDPAWRGMLRQLLDVLAARLPAGTAGQTVAALRAAPDDHLEAQASRLLQGIMTGLDLATAPLIGAGLQAYFTHLVLATEAAHGKARIAPFGRIDRATVCPCCGSLPTASVVRIGADTAGHRYLHCALCSTQWHMVRVKCAHCEGSKGLSYQSLEAEQGHVPATTGAAAGAVQAEACDACGHYLKILNMAKDAHVEALADDLASLTLDLLVSESGLERHGVNLMLLFGDPDAEPPPHPPDPGGP